MSSAPSVQHIGFLALDNYSMIAFSNAVEVLRMANYASGQTLYRWSVLSLDGQPARASNGIPISPTLTLEQAGLPDILFVCGGVQIQQAADARLSALLMRL